MRGPVRRSSRPRSGSGTVGADSPRRRGSTPCTMRSRQGSFTRRGRERRPRSPCGSPSRTPLDLGGRSSTGEGGQYRDDTQEDGHRPADQHPDTGYRVDGALGDGPQAPSFLVPSASDERVDAIGHADQSQEDEQDSRRQHYGSLPPKKRANSATTSSKTQKSPVLTPSANLSWAAMLDSLDRSPPFSWLAVEPVRFGRSARLSIRWYPHAGRRMSHLRLPV